MSWINEFLTSAWTLRDRSNAGILFGVRTQAKREAALFPQQMKISVALSFAGALQKKLLALAGAAAYLPPPQAECIGRSLVRQGEESPDSAGQDVPWLTRKLRC